MEDLTPNPLLAALHLHIQSIGARPIDARMLLELEKTCLLARELIAIGKAPDAHRKQNLIHSGDPMSLYESGYGSGLSYSSPNFAAPMAVSPTTETFGVQAIRELVNALATLMPKPPEPPTAQMSFTDVMRAIQLAKEAGELVLEQQLRQALAAEVAKTPAPPHSALATTAIDTELVIPEVPN